MCQKIPTAQKNYKKKLVGGIPSHMYYASIIIRKALEEVESIRYRPVHLRDVSQEKAENFIPNFFKQASTNETISKFDSKEHYPSLHKYTLSPAQDMLSMKSMGEARTSIHMGLSITCHKMTQSKIIV